MGNGSTYFKILLLLATMSAAVGIGEGIVSQLCVSSEGVRSWMMAEGSSGDPCGEIRSRVLGVNDAVVDMMRDDFWASEVNC